MLGFFFYYVHVIERIHFLCNKTDESVFLIEVACWNNLKSRLFFMFLS